MSGNSNGKGAPPSGILVDPEAARLESVVLGNMLVDPARNCGTVAAAHGAPAFAHWRTITPGNVADALEATIEAVRGGDLSALEAMLVSQAFALQSVFTDCATRARAQNSREASGTLMGLAMKAQAQCRATVQTIGELKAPRSTIFAKQANVNNGGQQQINNGADAHANARAREEIQPTRNELEALENSSGSTQMVGAAAPTSIGTYQAARPVDPLHRAAHRGRQKHERAER
jgi:hypothetical protein